MPRTSPSKRLYARKLRRPGTLIAQTSRRSGSLPQVKSDMLAGLSSSQSASAAAIFMGWIRIMYWAWVWPTTTTATVATRAYTAPKRKERPKASRVASSCARRMCQALIPSTKNAAVAMAPVIT
jgi:hypothetical protein